MTGCLLRCTLGDMHTKIRDYAANDPVFRGRIRPEAFLPAAIKAKNLPDHHVEKTQNVIFGLPWRDLVLDGEIGASA